MPQKYLWQISNSIFAVQMFAEAGCQLTVRGLRPHEDYVFAVAAFGKDGTMVGKAVGRTSKPLRTTFPLPLLTAWGYCCQVGNI